jgi:hypothetical protein
MWHYFTSDFQQATKEVVEATQLSIDKIYLFPVVSSRVEYRPHPRMKLPWSRLFDLDHFRFSQDSLTLDPPEGYGLILYVVPYSALWEVDQN